MRPLTMLLCAAFALFGEAKKEVVIISQITADPTNRAFRDSGDKLAQQLKDQKFDVDTVLMGNLPKMDVPSPDKLKDYLRKKLGDKACYPIP